MITVVVSAGGAFRICAAAIGASGLISGSVFTGVDCTGIICVGLVCAGGGCEGSGGTGAGITGAGCAGGSFLMLIEDLLGVTFLLDPFFRAGGFIMSFSSNDSRSSYNCLIRHVAFAGKEGEQLGWGVCFTGAGGGQVRGIPVWRGCIQAGIEG